ncbi:MAG: hypothetical protein JO319_21470 [Acidobacteriaceae bacterium]|nr:hypothetical protein [Acidobacteriaceae bacterium]
MTALERMNTYLARLELRFRLLLASRGAALTAGCALILTLLLVWVGNRFEFAPGVMLISRCLLFAVMGAVLIVALAVPLLRFSRSRLTRIMEHRVPGFEQRLFTVVERSNEANPFIEVLAEDTLRIAKENRVEELADSRWSVAFGGFGLLAAAIIVWLITAGPGYWSYGTSVLWTGGAPASRRPLYDIAVEPGNRTVRRKSDQMITARLLGFSAHSVVLHARYASASKWEQIPMQVMQQGNGYRFLFAALSEPIEYYVQANSAVSKHYQLRVKDLPAVKRIRVAVHFPARLQLKDVVDDPGGDIRAVEGSSADVSVLTDRPLEHGLLVLENGAKVPLEKGRGDWLMAHLSITKDGSYHVAAVDGGEIIRISDDYFIEAKRDEPPSVRIVHPGRDPHVSPIEEVPVTVEAADDFGVQGLELHYSVNGGEEQSVSLTKNAAGLKEAQGTATLYLENFKLVPGDIVSFYATARDAGTTTRSDIVFAQAEPFDFKFSQSQQAAGMGMGAGQDDDRISERQKQIIAATWNELKGAPKARSALDDDARFLSDLESKLQAQAKTLADRMGSRELTNASPEFETFSKTMVLASSQLAESADLLRPGRWHDALGPEQKALQSLLRAEAAFRNIQVAFGQRGGMGGSGAQRDLARMFDLELDTSKNQYETEQSQSQAASAQQKAIDEAFEKLQALSQRQQELAQQNSQQQAFDQRWQEEQLRREAEELRQQLQQLAQNSQGQGSAQSSQSGSQQPGSTGSQGSNAAGSRAQQEQQRRQMNAAMRQAMESLQRAEDEMRRAVSDHDGTARQRAAAQLAQAQDALNGALQQRAGSSISEMADRAQQIANKQAELARRMKALYGPGSKSNPSDEFSSTINSPGEMPEMNDPENPRYGYGYRRRIWATDLRQSRPATAQEKAIAGEKEQLAQELERLEKQMQQQEQTLAGTQPDASSKMRKALSDAEQKELALRMQKNAEWLRKGYGDRNVGMEDSVTAGVEQLSRDLRGVQQAVRSDTPGQDGRNTKAGEMLAQVESLRQMLENAQQNGKGQQQSGTGQQNSSQPGNAAVRGSDPGRYAEFGAANPAIDRNTLDNAIHQLYALRNQMGTKDRPLYNYIDGTLGYLRDLNANPNVLKSTIGDDAVASLERLEMELSKRAGEQSTLGARTAAREAAPERYQDAVAEYFKKLSQPQTKQQ